MAILKGIFQFNGKLGAAVGMKGDQGKNYARVYLDKIANPNTEAQVKNRTKVVLGGKLSKLTPAQLILGLNGANKRQRRAEFVKKTLRAITTSIVDGTTQAELRPQDIVLSEGAYQDLFSINGTLTGGVLSVAPVSGANWAQDYPDVKAVVVAAYVERGGDYVECVTDVMTPESQTVNFNIGTTASLAQVYTIPVVESSENGRAIYGGDIIALANSSNMAAQATFSESSNNGYANSRFEGTVTASL